MKLIYNHAKREIRNDAGDILSFEEAEKAYIEGRVTDNNLAMGTLFDHDGDMDAVEDYYQSVS